MDCGGRERYACCVSCMPAAASRALLRPTRQFEAHGRLHDGCEQQHVLRRSKKSALVREKVTHALFRFQRPHSPFQTRVSGEQEIFPRWLRKRQRMYVRASPEPTCDALLCMPCRSCACACTFLWALACPDQRMCCMHVNGTGMLTHALLCKPPWGTCAAVSASMHHGCCHAGNAPCPSGDRMHAEARSGDAERRSSRSSARRELHWGPRSTDSLRQSASLLRFNAKPTNVRREMPQRSTPPASGRHRWDGTGHGRYVPHTSRACIRWGLDSAEKGRLWPM